LIPLEFNDFKEALPLLGIEHAKNKAREIKFKLKELKAVLEYPKNKMPISSAMEAIINENDKSEIQGQINSVISNE
jgi:hypothetical protein